MQLLTQVSARAHLDHAPLPAPVSESGLAEAETALGFRLPALLAEVYCRVADGGFGPDYQLLSLIHGAKSETAVSAYLANRADNAGTDWAWPEGVLPILTWGCGMYAGVDCRSDDGMVLLFEPNPGDPHAAWFIDAPSLAAWLEHYVNNTGWWIKAEEGEDLDDLQLWPHLAERALQ